MNNPIITSARYNCVVGITPGVGEGTKYLEILAVNEFAIAFTNTSGRLLFSGNEPLQAALQRLLLFELDINIAFMKVIRSQKGKEATMVFELDGKISQEAVEQIKSFGYIKKVIMINQTKDGE